MSFKKLTTDQKRVALREHYEKYYQNLIEQQFDKSSKAREKNRTAAKERARDKIRLLSRERNLHLAEIDQAPDDKIDQLFKRVSGRRWGIFKRGRK